MYIYIYIYIHAYIYIYIQYSCIYIGVRSDEDGLGAERGYYTTLFHDIL